MNATSRLLSSGTLGVPSLAAQLLLAAAATGCFLGSCTRPAHEKQIEELNAAKEAMGGAGTIYILCHDEDGTRLEAELTFRGGSDVGDEDIRRLEGISAIIGLDLGGTRISDAGMQAVSTLENLEYLQIPDTDVSDDGLRGLTSLKKLTRLDIRSCKITPEASKILREIPSLQEVYAKGTPISDSDSFELNVQDDLDPFWREVRNP